MSTFHIDTLTNNHDHKLKPGRPRSQATEQAILDAALDQVLRLGFRPVSIESIAAQAAVGKTTIYRRWPNKAAVVMDAFFAQFGPETDFPVAFRALESLRLQMHSQAKAFREKYGTLVKSLLAEAQFDRELAEAFRDRWTFPRRILGRETIQLAIQQGDLRPDLDVEAAIDMLYAPLYYRLLIGSGPLSPEFVDDLFHQVIRGLKA